MGKEKNRIDIKELIRRLKLEHLLIHSEKTDSIEACSFSYNSKEVVAGCLFICKGYNFKPAYLFDAFERGAVCYIAEEIYETDYPYLLVRDVRKTLAIVASIYYDTVNAPIKLIGVTGTKGKSTTVYFLYNILKAAGLKAAYSTTVDMFDGINVTEAILTTPESDVCHKNLRAAIDNGCEYFIMETSSQAVKLDRIYGLSFDYGIFVNISSDHISPHEHHSFEEYFDCKQQIVRAYKNSVINYDDERFETVKSVAKEKSQNVLSYSVDSPKADIYADEIIKAGLNTQFCMHLPDRESFKVKLNMPGVFNVSNSLAAAGVAYMMNISSESIATGIEQTGVVGRMNIFEKNGYTVVVDYAHNDSSLKAALTAIREYYPGKKISVAFGCPGGKGLQRRRDMAFEASQLADYVYITSEDPGGEDPQTIADEVKGYLDGYGAQSEIILDRKEAVLSAIKKMTQSEIVLITGKGAEHYQLISGKVVPYEGDTVLADEYIKLYK